jgi:5-methylcytosine-specific restriction endonuclease McrA
MGHKRNLLKTARLVSTTLRSVERQGHTKVRWPRLKTEVADASGFVTTLARVGNRQRLFELDLWLDEWPGPSAKRYAISISAKRPSTIRALANRAFGSLRKLRVFTDQHFEWIGDEARLKVPLLRRYFGIPHLEIYESTGENFITVYMPEPISASTPCSAGALYRLGIFGRLFLDAVTLLARNPIDAERNLTAKEGRPRLRKHLHRERSSKLAEAAKLRDSYVCQICEVRFADVYGDLGVEFAEAHHTTYLSSLSEATEISVEQLITVCSNCHRMLHRMGRGPEDVRKLRTIVKQRRGA